MMILKFMKKTQVLIHFEVMVDITPNLATVAPWL